MVVDTGEALIRTYYPGYSGQLGVRSGKLNNHTGVHLNHIIVNRFGKQTLTVINRLSLTGCRVAGAKCGVVGMDHIKELVADKGSKAIIHCGIVFCGALYFQKK